MSTNLIVDYYTSQVRQEWRRLVKDAYRRLEFDTTLHFLSRYLPSTGMILDAGGGPGRYTIELARRGYDVALLDFTPANLEHARRHIRRAGVARRVKEVVEGSITDLSRYPDSIFDAVVCTGGPLSHVINTAERSRAVDELIRVAKPGAPIFVSVMGRLSALVFELTIAQHELEMPHFAPLRETGDYFGGSGFTTCHFFYPEEFRAAFEGRPVEVLEMVGLEGISTHHRKELNRVAKDEARWKIWKETHLATCTHPSVVGISEHMLIVCRKLAAAA